eukprot:CAMPEP_0173278452 /NCGR_PEP_ID=MMETSP1143-20121109/4623_1 /TAXON_ID=483371 /ORGANISM="non described non described, Strain CCMP2298" /LENGTH=367 /DNA_ID=CAMNT_0014215615 /DNA_START=78 /DNA_END=1181 /DNA_ORIENTATION=+
MTDSSSDDEDLQRMHTGALPGLVEETVALPGLALSAARVPLPLPLPVAAEVEDAIAKKKTGRKRKSLPMLEDGENPLAGLPLAGKKYKENNHFPWLELTGPTCHSEKQMQSGADLTSVKKKYRRMRCLDCAAYNAVTPWAQLWPRKFELQTLVDHSQSSHHVKSESARRKLGLPTRMVGDGEYEEEGGEVFLSQAGEAPGSARAVKNWSKAVTAAATDAHGRLCGTKGHGRPDWLHYEGQLCYSDKQQADAGLPPGTKKKYRKVQCTYCLEFLPESPWSVMKPRKFESAVLADHERSGYHQKTLELRNAHLSVGGMGPEDPLVIAMAEAMAGAEPAEVQVEMQAEVAEAQVEVEVQTEVGVEVQVAV